MMHIIHHHLHLILVYRLKEMCHLSLVCKILDHMNLVLLRLHHLYHLIHLNRHLGYLEVDLLEVYYLHILHLELHHRLGVLLHLKPLWLLLYLHLLK